MKRILIASDDLHTRARASEQLSGIDASLAECSVAEVGIRLGATRFDLLLLDVGHDPVTALETVDRLVSAGSDARILVVVEPDALGSLRVPVRVPSDFVVRTASAEEVVTRVRSLLWPGEEAAERDIVRLDGLSINLSTYQAHLDGEPVDFTFLEYSLFVFLVTHPDRTYSRETLMQRVWGSDYFGGSRTVDVHVRRIRSKIGPELSRHLETVRNVGYLWRT